MVTIERITNVLTIQKLLHDYNNVFSPPLESRIRNFREYANKLSCYSVFVVAIENDTEVVGLSALYANDEKSKEAYLAQIAVSQNHQGKGIGQLLLNYDIEYSKRMGMISLKLEVAKTNDIAVSFYKKNGFVLVSSIESSVLMRKML